MGLALQAQQLAGGSIVGLGGLKQTHLDLKLPGRHNLANALAAIAAANAAGVAVAEAVAALGTYAGLAHPAMLAHYQRGDDSALRVLAQVLLLAALSRQVYWP